MSLPYMLQGYLTSQPYMPRARDPSPSGFITPEQKIIFSHARTRADDGDVFYFYLKKRMWKKWP